MSRCIGTWGEAQVANYLRQKKFHLVAHSYHCRFGDLAVGLPRDYVTAAKQERIRKTALFYLSEKELDCPVRFDVAEVYRGTDGGLARIVYMKNAFEVEAN